ncbi:MAG: hypothetical protein CL946_06570 [Ectothiorhodospiraceae bacterium]|nr:hypothetical protein [Ectothiorhodospiraceae bacterium]
MALGLSPQTDKIKRFAKDDNTIYVKETDSSFAPLTDGDGTQWICIGTMKGTQLEAAIDEFKDKGDSGKVSVFEETIEQFVISTTAMQRDKNTRQLPVNVKDRFYQIAVKGQQLGTQTEAHALVGRISQAFTYALGGEGQLTNVKLVTLHNASSIAVTLPTEIAASSTITIPLGQMWATDDV